MELLGTTFKSTDLELEIGIEPGLLFVYFTISLTRGLQIIL